MSAAILEEPEKPHWLCVEFSVPGSVDFAVCYKIPEETVTFPPPSTDPQRMTTIDAQIISAAVVIDQEESSEGKSDAAASEGGSEVAAAATEEEDENEEQERTVLLDFTACLQKMAGPNGDFFGRPSLDMRLAMAESLDRGRTEDVLHTFLDQAIRGRKASTVLGYANGSEISVNPLDFPCSAPRAPGAVSPTGPK